MSDGPDPMMDGLPLRAVWFAPVGTPLPATVEEKLHHDFKQTVPADHVEIRSFGDAAPVRSSDAVPRWSFAVVFEFGLDVAPSYRVALPDVHVGIREGFRMRVLLDRSRIRTVGEHLAALDAENGVGPALEYVGSESAGLYETLVRKLAAVTAPGWRHDLLGRPSAQLAEAWRLQVQRYTDEVRELGRIEGRAAMLDEFRAAGGTAGSSVPGRPAYREEVVAKPTSADQVG